MDKSSGIFEKTIAFLQRCYDKLDKSNVSSCRNGYFAWSFVVLACFLIILLLNILTPLAVDDFGYLYIHAEDIKVTSISDVVHSQINHYKLWGGRSVVHFIAQSLLLLPPLVIDILNSLVYLVFLFLIYYHIKGRGVHSLSLFALINLVLWLIMPAYGDTILWTTGSANYLWGTTIVLSLLIPYRLYEGNLCPGSMKVVRCIVLFIGGVIAGWTNENTAAAMLFAIVLFFLYYRSMGLGIPAWGVAGLMGGIIGYAIMILAPGNMIRAGDAVIVSAFLAIYRLFDYTQTLFIDYGVFNLFYLIFLIMFWHFSKEYKSEILRRTLIYLAVFMVAVYSMVFSPSFPPRAWFGPLTFNIIAVGIIIYNLNYDLKFIRQIKCGILLVVFVMFMFSFFDAIRDVYSFYKISQKREVLVEEAKAKGLDKCEFERYKAKTKFTHTEESTANYLMKGYYGIDIKFKKE